jgi:hypothetical protein
LTTNSQVQTGETKYAILIHIIATDIKTPMYILV